MLLNYKAQACNSLVLLFLATGCPGETDNAFVKQSEHGTSISNIVDESSKRYPWPCPSTTTKADWECCACAPPMNYIKDIVTDLNNVAVARFLHCVDTDVKVQLDGIAANGKIVPGATIGGAVDLNHCTGSVREIDPNIKNSILKLADKLSSAPLPSQQELHDWQSACLEKKLTDPTCRQKIASENPAERNPIHYVKARKLVQYPEDIAKIQTAIRLTFSALAQTYPCIFSEVGEQLFNKFCNGACVNIMEKAYAIIKTFDEIPNDFAGACSIIKDKLPVILNYDKAVYEKLDCDIKSKSWEGYREYNAGAISNNTALQITVLRRFLWSHLGNSTTERDVALEQALNTWVTKYGQYTYHNGTKQNLFIKAQTAWRGIKCRNCAFRMKGLLIQTSDEWKVFLNIIYQVFLSDFQKNKLNFQPICRGMQLVQDGTNQWKAKPGSCPPNTRNVSCFSGTMPNYRVIDEMALRFLNDGFGL